MTEGAQATFSQSRNDLHWSYFAGEEDGTVRWSGYDDANWWDRVSLSEHTRTRVGKVTGRTFVVDFRTNRVTVFEAMA